MSMTTREVARKFFIENPEFKRLYKKVPTTKNKYGYYLVPAEHNLYPAEARIAFSFFVDNLARGGRIGERVAQNAVLG